LKTPRKLKKQEKTEKFLQLPDFDCNFKFMDRFLRREYKKWGNFHHFLFLNLILTKFDSNPNLETIGENDLFSPRSELKFDPTTKIEFI